MPDEPRIYPAPSNLPDLAGTYYVARGHTPFTRYLQSDGTWEGCAYYFPNRASALNALAQQAEIAAPLEPLDVNIEAERTEARNEKRTYQL